MNIGFDLVLIILPIFVFVLAMILTISAWRLVLILLLLCPFLACTLLMAGKLFAGVINREFNAIYSFGAFGSFAFMFYAITFPLMLYPSAAWPGVGALSAWAGCDT